MKWIPVYMVIGLLIWTLNNAKASDFDPCNETVAHVPRADVNYNASPVQIPDVIQIPLTIDMAERYGIHRLPTGTELDAQIGVIEIDGQGGIFYNGEDISGDIKDKCDEPDLTQETEKEIDFIDEIIKILPTDTEGVSEGG